MPDEKVQPNALPEPISDDGLERWMVQYQYAGKIMIGPILRHEFGAILARIERAEKDRDQARRAVCCALTKHHERGVMLRLDAWPPPSGTKEEVRGVCGDLYGQAEADRLFPKEEP